MELDDLSSDDDFHKGVFPIEMLPNEGKYTLFGMDNLQNTGFFIVGENYESREEARAVMNLNVKKSRENNEIVDFYLVNYRGISLETMKSHA
jgi:hypothetical protein